MNRKDLIRQYKETPRPMGVYRVRNKVTGKTLIGTSVNVPAILNRHLSGLRLGATKIANFRRTGMNLAVTPSSLKRWTC